MSAHLRVLCRLGVSVAFAAGCARPAPLARLPAPAPTQGSSICERPALPPRDVSDAKVNASFRAFAESWVDKMRAAGAAGATQHRIRDALELELRPTRDGTAPYVGILRYCDELLRCAGPTATTCEPSKRTAVTEIFRFQGDEWVY